MKFCTECGNPLNPAARFCGKCGKSLMSSPGIPAQARVEPPNATPAKPRANLPARKRTVKILAFVSSVTVVLALVVLAVYFFGTYDSDSNASIAALYSEEKFDKVQIDSAANLVESAFVNADTVKLSQILSPSSLEQKRPFFKTLQPYMKSFGNDFKTRKLLYATARYAVYEFSSAKGTFTAEFCLGDDGKWNLMQF